MKEEKINKIIDELDKLQDEISPYSEEWSNYWRAIDNLREILKRLKNQRSITKLI